MAYRDDISALGADHHWDFDGDSLDQIGSVNGTDTSIIYTDSAIAEDATNCATTNALTDRITLPTTTEINNSAQQRKAVCGWYQTTAIQAPPTRIYGEGDQTTFFQFMMSLGNASMFEAGEGGTTLQIFGPVLVPDRSYHLCGIFLGNTQGNELKFFVDGVEQTNAEPADRQPDNADLNARGVGEFGDPAGTVGVGGGVVLLQAARNGRYQHWATWGDEADADLTDTEVRVELFEKGALAENTISSDTEANMQTALDALGNQDNAALNIEIEAVSGGGDFTLELDGQTFDDLASMHIRYNGTADNLTIINTNGANADSSKCNAPFGGTLTVATEVTLTITALDVNDNSAISGARVYIEADSGGDLAAGTEIANTTTNGSGIATISFNYTSDQPIIGRVRKGSASPFYKTSPITGPITSSGLTQTILMIPDE